MRRAISEGWKGRKDLYVDLGASRILAAQKDELKIAIEIKSFSSRSELDDLEKALGQYTLYFDILAELQSERLLYLAVPVWAYQSLFEEPIAIPNRLWSVRALKAIHSKALSAEKYFKQFGIAISVSYYSKNSACV